MKKNLILTVFFALLGSIVFGFWQTNRFDDNKLHLVFCDVGQGDAIYLKTPENEEILIDGGPDDKVLDCLSSHRPFYDQEIEVVILTHPEADHLTGLISVIKRYKVNYLVIENIANSTAVFDQFRQAVMEEGSQIYNPKAGDSLKVGETRINFFWPKTVVGDKDLWQTKTGGLGGEEMSGGSNDYSLVFDIRYKDFIALQDGDAESSILEQISNLPSQVTVLKVPHHGSKKALSQKILEILQPKLAVISLGKNNRYGHPAQETVEILEGGQVKTLRTDQDGEIEIITDGQSWQIN